ncbi:MAG: sulfur reduction protein DsrJ [bacterium]
MKHLTLILAMAAMLLALIGTVQAGAGVQGTAKADELDRCVADTPFMRRSHFELILHQRDVTVHQGIRKTDDSLAGCVDCHARRDDQDNHVPINSDGEFCSNCHEYTAVSIDCFSCHSAIPEGEAE